MEKNKTDKNKYVGICKVGEKGQIVIPKEIRTMFDINPGDSVIVLCDKDKGIALLKADGTIYKASRKSTTDDLNNEIKEILKETALGSGVDLGQLHLL